MKVETKIENAKPFVTTISHNYVFHHGMLLSDTCSIVEEGHFYAMTSQRVIKNEYDSHDNQTSYYEESGGTYSTNYKWKKQFDEFNNLIYDADFNACNDYLPERETRMEYYPGGKMVKKETDDNGYKRTVTYYDETGRIQKVLYLPTACGTGGYYNNSNYGYGEDGKIYRVDIYSYE